MAGGRPVGDVVAAVVVVSWDTLPPVEEWVGPVRRDDAEPQALPRKRVAAFTRSDGLPALDSAAWHGPVAAYVRSLPETEADPLAVYLSVLAGLGHRLGSDTYVRLGADRHPALLWLLTVGGTATGRKGTAEGLSLGMLAEVGGIVARASGLVSGEGLADHFTPEDETTPDHRLLVVETEWTGVLARTRREGSSLSAMLRDAWDGRPLSTLGTKAGGARRKVEHHHVTIVGHITPTDLRTGMGDREAANGFLNRFLLAEVRRPGLVPFPKAPGSPQRDALERIVSTVATARAGERRLTDAAQDRYRQWYLAVEPRRELLPERIANATGRASGHLMRIALVLSVLDGCDAIDSEHIEGAAALTDYATATAARLYASGTVGVEWRVLSALCEAGGPQTRTDLRDALGRNVPSAEITAAIDALTGAALVTVETEHQDVGRPVTTITLTAEGNGYAATRLRGNAVSPGGGIAGGS